VDELVNECLIVFLLLSSRTGADLDFEEGSSLCDVFLGDVVADFRRNRGLPSAFVGVDDPAHTTHGAVGMIWITDWSDD
jgi:hypothetical protein